jgi:hypothetical protein
MTRSLNFLVQNEGPVTSAPAASVAVQCTGGVLPTPLTLLMRRLREELINYITKSTAISDYTRHIA